MINTEGLSAADLAAVLGNNNNDFGGNGAWWLLILLIFANNGWGNGNGFGGNGGYMPPYATTNDVQNGFNQSAVMSGLNGLTNAVSNGFAGAEISRANTLASITNSMNQIAMNQQNCCCENRLAVANLGATIAAENCADRQAVSDALRDVIANNTANTQMIIDKLNQQEIDALKAQNANLQNQLVMANLAASQNAQTATIEAGQRALANEVEQYVLPTARPAYIVQNPNCCQNFGYGCGCGN